ncbi:MAG: alpha/beta fold hydrolase [Erysipelotrichaceae bacterium]|nr:alpha/beta fold hydrolase [Erysipelotrichaceae bacterium]
MNFFFNKPKQTVVCVHGFGRNLSHEFDPLKAFLQEKGYDVVTFDMYDPNDPSDCNYKDWIEKAEKMMSSVISRGRSVILVGFSMGGVIASYLASIYPVTRLILVAPAFHYMNLHQVDKTVKGVFNSDDGNTSMPRSMTKAFQEIVDRYGASITHISCPVLMIHGTDDDIILPSSSKRAFQDIPHSKKRLIYVEGGGHKMLYDGKQEKTVHTLVLNMIEDSLF